MYYYCYTNMHASTVRYVYLTIPYYNDINKRYHGQLPDFFDRSIVETALCHPLSVEGNPGDPRVEYSLASPVYISLFTMIHDVVAV
jgi:hypothetical protein